MKISLNWLKEYIDIPLSAEELSGILTDLGLEVEGEEIVESVKGGLKGIVVGHVVECGKHPNADKLSLTKVDIGEEELKQIVCGAPNVAAGQKVLIATVGTTLYDKEGEPWKIKKGKIRGEVSEGMICAEDEVGLGAGHDGIMVLPEHLKVGMPAVEHFQLDNDVVYDIGLTPNRSDATSHIGVAKDLAAYFKVNGISDGELSLPSSDAFKVENTDLTVPVKVENLEACPRFTGVSISNVAVKQSPEWMQKRLAAIGVRPISNIVDITNFVLHEFGQPLHAYDLDKIGGGSVIVKNLPSGTPFKSLDEQERKLNEEDLMVCDGNEKGMCIGGVFGGIDSGVTEGTSKIFLEAAHFNAKSIRRTSTRHLLRTDAAICFEKGTDPNNADNALKRAATLIAEYGGGVISSEVVDIYPNKIEPAEVTVKYKAVNTLIGTDIPKEKVQSILSALNMKVTQDDGVAFTVKVPTDKADVTREADVIEEILRIYGFNNVPTPSILKSTIVHSGHPDRNYIKNTIADLMIAKGFNEMMNLSITQSALYEKALPGYEDNFVKINNTSNVNLDIMRPEMLVPVLETTAYNQNRQQHDLRLFEIGRSYQKIDGSIVETDHLSIVLKGNNGNPNWIKNSKSDFYDIKKVASEILERFNISNFQTKELDDQRFGYGLEYHRGPQTLAKFGLISKSILKNLDIKSDVYYAEFDLKPIFKSQKKSKLTIDVPSKFPSVRRDLALVIGESVSFQQIEAITKKVDRKLIAGIDLFDVYKNKEQLGEGKKSYAVSFTFENKEKTLKDKEVDKIMNKLITEFEGQLDALIRK